MEKYMTTKEAAAKWNITERRINVLCNEGKIAMKYSWMNLQKQLLSR